MLLTSWKRKILKTLSMKLQENNVAYIMEENPGHKVEGWVQGVSLRPNIVEKVLSLH